MINPTPPTPKTTANNKLVVVDTNCLVRVYFAALRPILGQPVAGYQLMTLRELADELKALAARHEFAWLGSKDIVKDVTNAVLPLTRAQQAAIRRDAPGIRSHGEAELLKHCIAKGLAAGRTLSFKDAKALAAALELQAALATDEWPLRLVAGFYDDDFGEPVELLSSVELLGLLEKQGLLSRDERIKTYASWLKDGAKLLRGSGRLYLELFGEAPPTAQD